MKERTKFALGVLGWIVAAVFVLASNYCRIKYTLGLPMATPSSCASYMTKQPVGRIPLE